MRGVNERKKVLLLGGIYILLPSRAELFPGGPEGIFGRGKTWEWVTVVGKRRERSATSCPTEGYVGLRYRWSRNSPRPYHPRKKGV